MSDRSDLSKSEKIMLLPLGLTILLFFVIFALFNYAGFERMCTADMYEDTLVARLMWEQKTLFPEGYVFGNQFYVVATPVAAALFYGLTGSMNLSMALATTLMSLLILLSLVWMLRPFVRNALSLLCGILALLGCTYGTGLLFQDEGQLFFTMASYYACYLICAFVMLGDYIRARKQDALRPAALLLALLLCFANGMQSLRQTCVSVLPLLAFELAETLRRRLSQGSFLPAGQRRPLRRALAYTGANFAGLLFIRLLDKPHHTIFNGASIFDGASLSGKLGELAVAFRRVSGLEWFGAGHPLVFSLSFIFFSAVLAGAAVVILRRLREPPRGLYCCWWVCVISLLAVVSASLVTSVSIRQIYLFMHYPLLALSIVTVLDALSGRLRIALASALCLVALGNAYFSYKDNLDFALDDSPTDAQQVCELAMERGCELVYGSLDYSAAFIAAYSDGALTAGGWDAEIIFKVVPYINIQNVYDWTDYRRAVFVAMPWEWELCRLEAEGNGAKLTVLGEFGDFLVFTSDRQLLYPLSSPPFYDPEAAQ